MTEKTASALKEAADSMGLEVEVRDDYSGRGMYGKTTHAVSGSWTVLLQCVAFAASQIVDEDGVEDFVWEMGKLSRDSMGYEMVVY